MDRDEVCLHVELENMGCSSKGQGMRQASMIFIVVTVLLDALSFGLVLPVMPDLVLGHVGNSFASATWWLGILTAGFAAAQFAAAPLLGALSDRFGRRPVILLSNLGMGINYVCLALAPHLWLLLLGRVICGATAASLPAANAYVADTCGEGTRIRAFGMIGAALGIGIVFGPALGGLLGEHGVTLPFWVAGCLATANFCYGLLVLPESLTKQKRTRSIAWRKITPIHSVGFLLSLPGRMKLTLALFVTEFSNCILMTVFLAYTEYRFGWGMQKVGFVVMLTGIADVAVLLSTDRFVSIAGARRTILIGIACGCVSFLIMGLAGQAALFLCSIPFFALSNLAASPIQAQLVSQVGADEQGRVQGAISSLGGMARIFAPYFFSQIFALSIGPGMPTYLSGAPFICAGLIFILAWVFAERGTLPAGPRSAEAPVI